MRLHRAILTGTAIAACVASKGPPYLQSTILDAGQGYADMPLVVKTGSGWLCVLTTGSGKEGHAGQHVVAMRSSDKGRTWTAPVDLEWQSGPEASWGVPILTGYGRVYVLYAYNARNVRSINADPAVYPSGKHWRVDSLGALACRYSDDGGATWSERQYIPIRETAIDRTNGQAPGLRMFWLAHAATVVNGHVYVGMSKVGKIGKGLFEQTEAFLLASDNVLTERDPAQVLWRLLPDGEHGLTAPTGTVAEEPAVMGMSDGRLYCAFRTGQGYACEAYSVNQGHTWTEPQPMVFPQPRAAIVPYSMADGRYLLWCHHNTPGKGCTGRNRVYLAGGIERGGRIIWGAPRLFLDSGSPAVGVSYPCFIEDRGLWLTESNKTVARVHRVPGEFLDSLFGE